MQEGGVRLDAAVLREFPSSSRAFVREAISLGLVLVGGSRTDKGRKLRKGDLVSVVKLMESSDNRVKPFGVCPSPLFEDEALLAFDKPSSMPVQPLTCRETGTLMNAVVSAYPECREVGDSPLMAGAVHRIDADTSGLVLVARSSHAFERMREQFSQHTVRKTYLALVEGAVAVGGTLENDLVHDPQLPYCRMIDFERNRLSPAERAKLKPMHAVTEFRPIGYTFCGAEERTLIEVVIYTGVTHQIRAQLAMAGMHIINDRLYGAFAIEGQKGHCLHSYAAAFNHPISGDSVEIRTQLPDWADLRSARE